MNAWHNQSIPEVASLLATNVEQGLADKEVAVRLARYGPNKLRKGRQFSASVIFVSQFKTDLPKNRYDIWHDRAVFHFLTELRQRTAYIRQVLLAVKPGGHVIVATFGPEGPLKCSGLDVMRYDADALHDEFGAGFQLEDSATVLHATPFGSTQQFVYCLFKIG